MSHETSITECKKAVVDIHSAQIIRGEVVESTSHYLFECHYKALVFVANYNAVHKKHENSLAQFGGFYNVSPQSRIIETEYPKGYL